MNNGNSIYDELMERVSDEHRERFIKSRVNLEKHFSANDEVLAIAMHLDNVCAVMCDLTSGIIPRSENATDLQITRTAIKQMTDDVRLLQKDMKEIQLTATILTNVSKFHLLVLIIGSYIVGALTILFIHELRHLF